MHVSYCKNIFTVISWNKNVLYCSWSSNCYYLPVTWEMKPKRSFYCYSAVSFSSVPLTLCPVFIPKYYDIQHLKRIYTSQCMVGWSVGLWEVGGTTSTASNGLQQNLVCIFNIKSKCLQHVFLCSFVLSTHVPLEVCVHCANI